MNLNSHGHFDREVLSPADMTRRVSFIIDPS